MATTSGPPWNETGRQKKDPILNAIARVELAGHAYVPEIDLLQICTKGATQVVGQYQSDLKVLLESKLLRRDDGRIYSAKTWDYEMYAARRLAEMLALPTFPDLRRPIPPKCRGVTLDEAQREAVRMALTNRLSLILGGAGSGKTTIIRAIRYQFPGRTVIAAPTGKAARNLMDRAGLRAITVHAALGKVPDEDFISDSQWAGIGMVIIDEASMLTLEMLAGILSKVQRDCRIVLVGDPMQLPAVGAGNVVPDLLALGVPHITLSRTYRITDGVGALRHNVTKFDGIRSAKDLLLDGSFKFKEVPEAKIARELCSHAFALSRESEVQPLCTHNVFTAYSVDNLNAALQSGFNPSTKYLEMEQKRIKDGDRVMITCNDRVRGICNGDTGIFHMLSDGKGFEVDLLDGRKPRWDTVSGLKDLVLAYALTIHKSQGSQYDTVILPVSQAQDHMLNRNLFYTGISRAKKRVILLGDWQSVDDAMKRKPPRRRSMMVERTRRLMKAAS